MTVLEEFNRAFTSYAASTVPVRPRRPPLLSILARALGHILGRSVAMFRTLRTAALTVAGLGFGVSAAFQAGRVWGLAALAVSAFILEWAIRDGSDA